MSTLLCIGLGYCARHYVAEFGGRFDRIVGTTRSARARRARPRIAGGRSVEMLLFDATFAGNSPPRSAQADALLISAAPADGRDPVLAALGRRDRRGAALRSVVYLSTLGVYGDSGGAWIDETTPVNPAHARRGSARIDAELAWQALGARRKMPVAILRLGGIYGPGQNGMFRLLRGTVHRIAKPGHVSNRVHVHDIAQAIEAAFERAGRRRVQRGRRRTGPAERSDRLCGASARHRCRRRRSPIRRPARCSHRLR